MANSELERADLDPMQDPLWARIEAYEFDALDPGEPFAARLARENRWSDDYAERVIEEYRRFCYLAIRAGHPVVPSDQVDQVWHMHMGYSRDYWQVYCANVLGDDLHHSPARTDAADAAQCRAWYEATLATYERISGERPPADIWTEADIRFGRDGAMRRVSAAEYLIIRRPPKGLLWVIQVGLILLTLYFLWQGALMVAIGTGAVTGALALYRDRTDNRWKARPWRDGEDGGVGTGGCSSRGVS